MLTNLLILLTIIFILYQCYTQPERENMENKDESHDELVKIMRQIDGNHNTKMSAKNTSEQLYTRLSKLEKNASRIINHQDPE